MNKTIRFGKIDYTGNGIENNEVTVEIEYLFKEDGNNVFSCYGNIWNSAKTDVHCGGQCLDEISQYINTPLFNEIYRLWKLYHGHNRRQSCEHQRNDINFQKQLDEEIIVYNWLYLNDDLLKEKKALTKLIKNELETKGEVKLNKRQQYIYSLEECIHTHIGDYDNTVYKHSDSEIEYRSLKSVFVDEHEKGLLGKPCLVCGHKYGTRFVYEPILPCDKKIIYEILVKSDRKINEQIKQEKNQAINQIALTEEEKEKIKEIYKECKREYSLPLYILDFIHGFDYEHYGIIMLTLFRDINGYQNPNVVALKQENKVIFKIDKKQISNMTSEEFEQRITKALFKLKTIKNKVA